MVNEGTSTEGYKVWTHSHKESNMGLSWFVYSHDVPLFCWLVSLLMMIIMVMNLDGDSRWLWTNPYEE